MSCSSPPGKRSCAQRGRTPIKCCLAARMAILAGMPASTSVCPGAKGRLETSILRCLFELQYVYLTQCIYSIAAHQVIEVIYPRAASSFFMSATPSPDTAGSEGGWNHISVAPRFYGLPIAKGFSLSNIDGWDVEW